LSHSTEFAKYLIQFDASWQIIVLRRCLHIFGRWIVAIHQSTTHHQGIWAGGFDLSLFDSLNSGSVNSKKSENMRVQIDGCVWVSATFIALPPFSLSESLEPGQLSGLRGLGIRVS
jgi:hypothetical protein